MPGLYRNKMMALYDNLPLKQLKACLTRAREDFRLSQSEESAVECEVLYDMIHEEEQNGL